MKIVFKNLKYYIHANSYEECQNIKTQIYYIGQTNNSVRQKLSAVKIGENQRQFKDWERSSRYRHGPTQFLPDQLTKLTTEGAEQNKRQ